MKLTPNQAALVRALQGGAEDAWAGINWQSAVKFADMPYMFTDAATGCGECQVPFLEANELIGLGLLFEKARGVWMLTEAGRGWKGE